MKKILIVAPLEIRPLLDSFPAIHGLKKSYPNSEIHLLLLENLAIYVKYLDCKIDLHLIKKEEFTLTQLHKYAVNKNEIFNIDIAFDFEGAFLTSYLMYAFRARLRFATTENKWTMARLFQTKSKLETKNIHELIASNLAMPLDTFVGFSRGESKIIKEERFISLFFDNTKSVINDAEKLAYFLSDFDLFSIGIFINEINVGDAELLEESYRKYFKNLKVGFRLGSEKWDLPKSLLMSSIIMTNLPWISSLASYYGLPSILWNIKNISTKNNGFIVYPTSFYIQDFNNVFLDNTPMTLHESVDLIYNIFKIEKEKAPQEEGLKKIEAKLTLL